MLYILLGLLLDIKINNLEIFQFFNNYNKMLLILYEYLSEYISLISKIDKKKTENLNEFFIYKLKCIILIKNIIYLFTY